MSNDKSSQVTAPLSTPAPQNDAELRDAIVDKAMQKIRHRQGERTQPLAESCEHGIPLNEPCEPCKHPAWGQPPLAEPRQKENSSR